MFQLHVLVKGIVKREVLNIYVLSFKAIKCDKKRRFVEIHCGACKLRSQHSKSNMCRVNTSIHAFLATI